MIVDSAPDEASPDAVGRLEFAHDPVMVDVIVDVFSTVPAGVILDATVGGGGHARAILESRSDLDVLALDRDADALRAAQVNLAAFSGRTTFHRGKFDTLADAMAVSNIESLSGALFDLGVSSHQFDVAERGFSYRFDAPLDMRMDRSQQLSAHDLVNELPEDELSRILHEFADERFAMRIARAIVRARPVRSTVHLSEVVASAIPAPARRRGGHPAKRTFQALRIAVNEELTVLPRALDLAVGKVHARGRIAVLSYHSGEDRIVKERFAHHTSGGCTCPHDLPCVCGAKPLVQRVRVSAKPSLDEQNRNPRSASARLRVVEVI